MHSWRPGVSVGRRIRAVEDPSRGALPERPEDLLRQLGGPALLRIPGRDRSRARALVTLLHGNEPSGLCAVHAWLRSGAVPEVDAWVFIGAVEAALEAPGMARRVRSGGRDLNRCFLPPFDGTDGETARELLAVLREARPEALLDVHDTTGHTPPYCVGPALDAGRLALASLFAERYVHSDLTLGALVEATRSDFPGVVLECGRAGHPASARVAMEGVTAFLHAERLPAAPVRTLQLVHAPVRVSVQSGARLAFGDGPHDGAQFTARADLDRRNFERLAAGAPIGWVAHAEPWPLVAVGAGGTDVSRELFAQDGGCVVVRRDLVPIMVTTDPGIAREDCLFYAVQPLED